MDSALPKIVDVDFIRDAFSYLPQGVTVLTFVVLIYFAVYSIILLYHWLRYGRRSPAVWIAIVLYFGVSSVIVGTLILAARDIL